MLTTSLGSSALTGKWRGDLNLGSSRLPLIFSFREDASGKMVATMDSPQQNARDIPLEIIFISQDSIVIECGVLGASYNARIEDCRMSGTFMQRGFRLPLTLTPEMSLIERRPQTPQPPFPYIEKDTVFCSADGTRLSGTLTLPGSVSASKCPIVVMVTGSGPQNRDEEIFEHRPFAVIADYLARRGIASFRYDDRGVAASDGNYMEATINTFKNDARSALEFVRNSGDFNKIGILGHSEGGTIAVLIAADGGPDFVISLAGMVVPAKETLIDQNIRVLDKTGITGTQKDSSVRLIELLFDEIISQSKSGISQPIDIDLICRDNSLDVPPVVLMSVKRSNSARNAYFDSMVSLNPAEALKRIECPVLAVNGSKDTQVKAGSNLEVFRRNVKNVDIRLMDGLNHLMQHAVTGEVTEYGDLTETISPEVLAIIYDFISNR